MKQGHPISRKCIEFISRFTKSTNSIPKHASVGILEYLKTIMNQKVDFLEWINRIQSPCYTEFCLPVGSFDRQTTSLLVILLYEWALLDGVSEDSNLNFIFNFIHNHLAQELQQEESHVESLFEYGWKITSHQDDQLILILSYQLELDMKGKCILFNGMNSHSQFLFFLEQLGYSTSTFIDFLMSNETVFLEYFLKYLKWIQISVLDFKSKCKNKSQLYWFFTDLHDTLHRMRDTFPYSPLPLLKRLLQVLSLLSIHLEIETNVANLAQVERK